MSQRLMATAIFLLLSAVLASCGGGEETPAGSTGIPALTPLPTYTREPISCPPLAQPEEFPQVRAFAAQIDAALSSQDAEFFLSRATEQEVTCTGNELGGPCLGQQAGTVLKGIRVGTWLTSESFLGTMDEFRQFLSEQLGSPGAPALSLYALARVKPGRFIAMTTALEEPGGGEKPSDAWLMFFDRADDDWHLTELLYVEPAKIDDWLSAEALSNAWQQCAYWERWTAPEVPAAE